MKFVLPLTSFCLGNATTNKIPVSGSQNMFATDKGKLLSTFNFASEDLRMKKEKNNLKIFDKTAFSILLANVD